MHGTGTVWRIGDDEVPSEYTGTCAKYVLPYVALTAKHCVPEGTKYGVGMLGEKWEAVRVERHPKADLAVLVGKPFESVLPGFAFDSIRTDSMVEGGDFHAYGFPAEGPSSVGRYFRGHIQRYFPYKDTYGDTYFAAELSIPAPNGLSGGPVVNPMNTRQLVGIVTANTDTYTIEHSHEELDDKGHVTRAEIRRIISYGVAAMMLEKEAGWVDEIVEDARKG